MIGLMGFGTVGAGVAEILAKIQDPRLKLSKVYVRNPQKAGDRWQKILQTSKILSYPDLAYDRSYRELQFVADPRAIIDDPEIDIVMEATGADQAGDWLMASLAAHKHVVTSNKMIASARFEELSALAAEQGKYFLYEACVGGGIPIIREVQELQKQNRISTIEGILNGTSNYILSRMEEGTSYDEALAQAQALGYAERDPSDDVKGYDALRKLRILATLAFSVSVTEADIICRGIDRLQAIDLEILSGLGKRVKLLAKAVLDRENWQVKAQVYPTALDRDRPVAKIMGVDNAIFLDCDVTGYLGFQGPGAGDLPSASSMLADLYTIVESSYSLENPLRDHPVSCQETRARFYLRPDRKTGSYDGIYSECLSEKNHAYISRELPFSAVLDFPGTVIAL